jgi:hypothetical protein
MGILYIYEVFSLPMGSFDLFVASVFKVCMQVLTDNVRVKLVVANMRHIVRIYPQP